ncbi:hypothetical protein [Parafrigoribacterium soli]|uniref:hypothetical protein n=1 Tax=Parafrigoribacterium soli TaxID=3144663 RepID=UPI0032EC5D3A
MSDLRIDTHSLRDLGGELGRIGAEFEHANTRSDTIADAVGHDGLGEAISDFAHGWDDRRKDMVDSIQFMAKAATGIADAFDDADSQLAQALTNPAPASAPPTSQPHGPAAR